LLGELSSNGFSLVLSKLYILESFAFNWVTVKN
jgi:hypothetical protein